MHTRRINSNTIRKINAARVFHGIRKAPGISPQGLSKATGIDLATISIILASLEQDGLVERTQGQRTGRSGRPNSLLSINEKTGVLAGVAVDVDESEAVLCSFAGTRLASLRFAGGTDQARVIAAIKAALATLLKQAGYPRKALAGVGVGVPGLVGLNGRLALAPNLDWHDVDFGGALSAALAVPVQLENDIKAAAAAEHLFGQGAPDADFIYLSGRSGVGGGLYLGGAVYRGPLGMAGEVGHMKLVPNGRPCACGGFGCFETYVSERAIFDSLLREAKLVFPDIAAVREAALRGEAPVCAVLAECGRHLGLGLANLANIFAPSRIVLGGAMGELSAFLLPAARPVFEANALREIRCAIAISVSSLGAFAVPMGGIAIALQHFLEEPHAAALRPHHLA
ncbi:ROK family transcriptional regulator [Acidocella sp.]|uniref:ROK family transcriptional regulator n=1 Tax=Acidocella sp. TaxID=50710 RepID=UPI002613C8A6|nr:ROK family transcriptional regulator [Acidocella sp.]